MSHSVLRRYTPPTCTLEIIGNQSPLSQWMGQPVLKNLRFQLSLDDPKLSDDRWITLRGDRTQLEALCEAVSSYVHSFLEQTAPVSRLNALAAVTGATQMGTIAVLPTHLTQTERSSPPTPNAAGISLQPKGLVAHELILGNLATAETGAVCQLSAIQLFDLANALDDYATEIVSLPSLQHKPAWVRSAPAWAPIAAVALVAVGLSTSLMRFNTTPVAQTTAPATSQGASSSDQQIATQLPPTATTPSQAPAASNQKLPPPPPPGATKTPAPLPTVVLPPVIPPNPTVVAPSGTTTQPTSPAPSSTIALVPPAAPTAKRAPSRETLAAPAATAPATKLDPEFSIARSQAADSFNTAESASRGRSAPSEEARSTAFDTIPQVAEARSYFQQRWNPPQGLPQSLDYSLVVNSNGAIQQIIPLTQTSGDYVDRTGIPLVGEAFVSPLSKGRNARIRLVLSPDGNVQTFLEKLE